jgi:Ser/Thr protein kinase RdoA (MazF antagonist)
VANQTRRLVRGGPSGPRTEEEYGDLAPSVRERWDEVRADLPSSFEPVLARIDHGPWNYLVDDTGSTIEADIDWGSLFAVPAAYDHATVEFFMAGGMWLGLDDVADHRDEIRTGLLDGYRECRPFLRNTTASDGGIR